jgi:hypothetical protein
MLRCRYFLRWRRTQRRIIERKKQRRRRVDSGLGDQEAGFAQMVVVLDGSCNKAAKGIACRGIDAQDVFEAVLKSFSRPGSCPRSCMMLASWVRV